MSGDDEITWLKVAIMVFVFLGFGFAVGFVVGRSDEKSADERARRSAEFLIEACRQGAREVCK